MATPVVGQLNTAIDYSGLAKAAGGGVGRIDLSGLMPKLIDNVSTPFLDKLNKRQQIVTAIRHEFQDRNARPQTVLTTQNLAAGTTLNLTAGQGLYVRVGDVLTFPLTGENVLVTAVNTDALTIVRDYDSAAPSAGAADFSGAGAAMPRVSGYYLSDGAAPQSAISIGFNPNFNFLTIQQEPVVLSSLEQAVTVYGDPDKFARLLMDAMTEINRRTERTAMWSKRKDSTTGKRAMGGFEFFTSTAGSGDGGNYTNASFGAASSFTQAQLDTELKTVWDNGGATDYIVCDSTMAAIFNGFAALAATGRVEVDGTAGDIQYGYVVNSYRSRYGAHAILMDRNALPSRLYLVNAESNALIHGKAPVFLPKPQAGSAVGGFVEQWVTYEQTANKWNRTLKVAP